MANKTFYVKCPKCNSMLEVDVESEKIVQTWDESSQSGEPGKDTGDRLAQALKKLENEKEKRKTKFEQAKDELELRKKKAQETFSTEIKRIQETGEKPTKPETPFDFE